MSSAALEREATAGTRVSGPNSTARDIYIPAPAYVPIELSFDLSVLLPGVVPTLSETSPRPNNPWLDYRLTAVISRPAGGSIQVAGFFAGDGTEGDECSGTISPGNTWKVRFTPENLPGYWGINVYLEYGVGNDFRPINISDELFDPNNNPSAGVTRYLLTTTPLHRNVIPPTPNAPGFRAKGFLQFDVSHGTYYYRFSNPSLTDKERYFIKTGTDSPENLFAYKGFWMTDKDPVLSGGVRHEFETPWPTMGGTSHASDWLPGDPTWVTTTWERTSSSLKYYNASGQAGQDCSNQGYPSTLGLAGKGLIGALRYLASKGVNSIYFLPLNLGGDGADTWPFADVPAADVGADLPGSCNTALSYSVKRMQEWNTVLDFAMQRGIMAQFVLHEEENDNLEWLGYSPELTNCPPPGTPDRSLTWARRLYLKQMVAHFGHHLGIKWNLCEENELPGPGVGDPEFDKPQLNAMATWIERWDTHDHPISVHSYHGNPAFIYEEILSQPNNAGDWLDATSFQIHAGEPTNSNDPYWMWATAPDEYNAQVEFARMSATLFGNRPAVIDVDEQGSGGIGASGWDETEPVQDARDGYNSYMASAEGRRRLVLYDILFSGGNLEWYCGSPGANQDYGGGDQSVEEFRSRRLLWEYSAIARQQLSFLPFWLAVPNDARVTGETHDGNLTGNFGGAQVFEHADASAGRNNFHAIYYPTLDSGPFNPMGPPNSPPMPNPGAVDMSYAASSTQRDYAEFWIDPRIGTILSGSVTYFSVTSISSTRVPMVPSSWTSDPNRSPDLICIINQVL